MFSVHPHIETHVHTETHTPSAGEHADPVHASSPASVASSGGFPSGGASGHPSGLLGRLSMSNQTSVKLPGDASSYVVKDSSNTRTPQPLYTSSPETGDLKQTPKMGIYDGNGGVTLDKGLLGGGQESSKQRNHEGYSALSSYNPPTGPFSAGRPPNSPGNHSYSDKSAWNNPSTGSSSAPPALPPRSNASVSLNPANFPKPPKARPQPNPRYLTESGDGQSKHWVIRDGRGGFKPADSSIDKYGTPTHIVLQPGSKLYGKGQWTGPTDSVDPPPARH